MSGDFLDNLTHSVGPTDLPALRPRPASRFESVEPSLSNLPLFDTLEPTRTEEEIDQPANVAPLRLPQNAPPHTSLERGVEPEQLSARDPNLAVQPRTAREREDHDVEPSLRPEETSRVRSSSSTRPEIYHEQPPTFALGRQPLVPTRVDQSLVTRLDQLAAQLQRVTQRIDEPLKSPEISSTPEQRNTRFRPEAIRQNKQHIERIHEVHTIAGSAELVPSEPVQNREVTTRNAIDSPRREVVVERRTTPAMRPGEERPPKLRQTNVVVSPEPNRPREPSQVREGAFEQDVRPHDLPPLAPQIIVERPQSPAATERTVNVTIGRIEVRAVQKPNPMPPVRVKRASSAVMSLNDYMRRRAGGGA